MKTRKAIVAGLLAAAFLATSAGGASARWYHHGGYGRGPGPVLGLLGAVVVGAATIATAPLAIIADAAGARRDGYEPPEGYGPRDYYGPPPDAYAPPPPPPPRYYRRDPGYGYGYGYDAPPPRYYGY